MKMRRCEDEKVRYRPPLLEEPCAQTLSGKMEQNEPAKCLLLAIRIFKIQKSYNHSIIDLLAKVYANIRYGGVAQRRGSIMVLPSSIAVLGYPHFWTIHG